MKFLLWHIHEWVYNSAYDSRKCADCGKIQYGELVGISLNEPATIVWRDNGFPCEACREEGIILVDGEIITCQTCGGTGYRK